ncbi:MAG: hypothetical protein HY841_02830 [Bacteroidetes bacterium]|nr:hypothetical protein [Bacteroidota bacterium]
MINPNTIEHLHEFIHGLTPEAIRYEKKFMRFVEANTFIKRLFDYLLSQKKCPALKDCSKEIWCGFTDKKSQEFLLKLCIRLRDILLEAMILDNAPVPFFNDSPARQEDTLPEAMLLRRRMGYLND